MTSCGETERKPSAWHSRGHIGVSTQRASETTRISEANAQLCCAAQKPSSVRQKLILEKLLFKFYYSKVHKSKKYLKKYS